MNQDLLPTICGAEFRLFLDEMHDAIIVRDLEDQIVLWNKGAERLYGWSADEVSGHNIYDVLLQEDLTNSETRARSLIESGAWLGELCQVAKDGRDIVVQSRWKLIRDNAGQPSYVLINNTDITEKKILENQLFAAQRMETIGRLASAIAHDLSNALAPITIIATILQQSSWEGEVGEFIESLKASTRYATALIDQMLSFGKGSGEGRVSVQPGYLIKECVRILRSVFPKSIEIKIRIDPDAWTISANVTKLRQAVMNVCMNARDAMPGKGTLTLIVENVLEGLSRYVCITFKDTGVGIPPQIINKIMYPFFSTKEPDKGTGLGLFIVSRIVEEHRGVIKVSSDIAQGTQFQIYLPAEG